MSNYHTRRARANKRHGHYRKARQHATKAATEHHKAVKESKKSH
jgi:hypothetical protein